MHCVREYRRAKLTFAAIESARALRGYGGPLTVHVSGLLTRESSIVRAALEVLLCLGGSAHCCPPWVAVRKLLDESFAASHGWSAIIALARYASIAWHGMLRMYETSCRE